MHKQAVPSEIRMLWTRKELLLLLFPQWTQWIATRARLHDCDLSERAFGTSDIPQQATTLPP